MSAGTKTTMSKLDKVEPTKVSAVEAAALTAWEKYHHQSEPLAIDFGKKMLALRDELSSRGKDGAGFAQWLKKHEVPRSTAYFWVTRYEQSIGKKTAKVKPTPKKPAGMVDSVPTNIIEGLGVLARAHQYLVKTYGWNGKSEAEAAGLMQDIIFNVRKQLGPEDFAAIKPQQRQHSDG
jgi:hypothetical protein